MTFNWLVYGEAYRCTCVEPKVVRGDNALSAAKSWLFQVKGDCVEPEHHTPHAVWVAQVGRVSVPDVFTVALKINSPSPLNAEEED